MKKRIELYPLDLGYEIKEREAILAENNPDMNPVHVKNKGAKEIRERTENEAKKCR